MAIRTMGPSGQYETGLDAAGAALPELLAPAGGLDQMLAAIAAGADAKCHARDKQKAQKREQDYGQSMRL